ncbi:hypothetical protein [Aminobacterium colombiense]|uniref:hypothetical protein n=1 Tax=Aminobacterium colombiense TaxID=81468 RepID=UPI002598FBF6|nr:hypothetical protein [uncultured Aminobacterium sp.]
MQIQQDKIKHFIAGAIASIVVYVATFNTTIALAFSALLGIGKEIYDYYGHGTPEWLDFVATVAGGLVGVTLGMVL